MNGECHREKVAVVWLAGSNVDRINDLPVYTLRWLGFLFRVSSGCRPDLGALDLVLLSVLGLERSDAVQTRTQACLSGSGGPS